MIYIATICSKKLEINNKVGLALIRQYQERFPDDAGYVLEKADEIRELNINNCLLWWFNLDDEGKEVFASILGMPEELLLKTCHGLKWLANN